MLQKHRESQQPLVMNGHQGDSQQEAGYLEPRSTVRRGSKPQYSPDSGVDVHGIQTDIPMEQLSWQPRAQFRHPQTRESVAVEGHEYEQLPGQRRQMTMYADIPDMNPDPTPSPPPLSKLPTPPGSRSTSMNDVGKSSNFDLHKPPSEQRRRENPLYDNMPEYKSMGSLMSDSHSPHRTKCLCVLAVLAVLLAIIAIVLGVLVFTIANTGNSSTLKPTASPVIDDSKIEALTKKIEDLETKLRLLEGSLGNPEQNASLATKVGSNSVYISDIQQNISQQQSVINEILNRVEGTEASANTTRDSLANITSNVKLLASDVGVISDNLNNTNTQLAVVKDTTDTHSIQINKVIEDDVAQNDNFTQQFNKITTLLHSEITNVTDSYAQLFADVYQNISSQYFLLLTTQESVSVVENSLQHDLLALNISVYQELYNISKMEGPQGLQGFNGSQGPSGAGNLSQCRLRNKEHGSNSSPTETGWGPDLEDFDTWVTLGVHCTVSGGTTTYGKQRTAMRNGEPIKRNEEFLYQYQCICSGGSNIYCKLLYWQCPLVS